MQIDVETRPVNGGLAVMKMTLIAACIALALSLRTHVTPFRFPPFALCSHRYARTTQLTGSRF